MQIRKTIKAEIVVEKAELLQLFIDTMRSEAQAASGKECTCWVAFAHLVGIPDVQAVKVANNAVDPSNRITTDEFRRWLPTVFSKFAAEVLGKR